MMSTNLDYLASKLWEEFRGYAQATRPPENPLYDYDLSFPYGAQQMAARLGYRIFRPSTHSLATRLRNCPEPTHHLITDWWAGENRSAPVAAALGPSNVTVVEIDGRDLRGFTNLARWEDLLGRLPRTRIVQTPEGFQVHMRGTLNAGQGAFGSGLVLRSLPEWVLLPGTHIEMRRYRWLRVGDLEATPDWVLDRRKTGATKEWTRR